MSITNLSFLCKVVQVLIALSVAVLVIFTVSSVLRVGESSDDLSPGDTSVKHFLQATRSQIYPLQALAAFILINIYLLLQISQVAYDSSGEASNNGKKSQVILQLVNYKAFLNLQKTFSCSHYQKSK